MGKISKNLVANYLGQFWTAVMGFAFIPLYIRYLGIEAYGLIGLFVVLQGCLSLLDLGMTPTLNREMGRLNGGGHTAESIRDLLRTIEIIAFAIGLTIFSSIAISASWVTKSWLNFENLPTGVVAQAITAMGCLIAFRLIEGIYRSCVVGLQRQVLVNIIGSIMATLRGVGAVGVLAWISPSIYAFFIWQGLISIVAVVLFAIATYHYLPTAEKRATFSVGAIKNVRRFAGGMLLISLLALLLTQIDKILLSKLLNLRDYGYYSLAFAVSGSLFVLVSPITQATYPRLCELTARNDVVKFTDTFHLGAQAVSVIAGSAAIVVIAFSEVFLRLWTQNDDLAANTAKLLSLLMLGNLMNAMVQMPYQAQLAYGLTGLGVKINTVAVLIIVPAIIWVTPRYGAEGAAWVWVCLNSSYFIFAMQLVYRQILSEEKLRWYFFDVFLPVGSAALTVIIFKSLWTVSETLGNQILCLIIASVLSVGTSCFSASKVRLEIKKIVRRQKNVLR
jgi:O-antigen/teichoic acid export membrane protein